MMKKQLYLLYLLLLSVQLVVAQTTRYEYWLDNGYDSRTVVADNVDAVSLNLDISAIKPGLHYFSFRAQGKSGQWGGISRYLFFMREEADSTVSMAQYEYWLDNQHEMRTTVEGSTSEVLLDLDISSIKPGLHYLNFRTQGKSGQWGGLSRYLFFMREEADSTAISMAQYEYWLDNNYDSRTIVKGSYADIPLDLDINSLRPGLHYFNVRAQGKSGQWGGLSRYLFFIKDGIGQLAHIEYWLDERQDVIAQQVTDSTVVITMDISNLAGGDHTFYMEGVTSDGSRCMLNGYEFNVEFAPAETVATPTFSWEDDVLTIRCATEGATILYSAQTADENGVYGADAFALYEGPFEYRADALLKARATKEGMEDSDTLTLEYPYTAWQQLKKAIEYSVTTVMMCVDNQKVRQEDVMQLKYMAEEAETYYNERQLKRNEIERMAGDLMARSDELRYQLEAAEYVYDAGNGVLTISGGTTVAEALEAAGGRDKIAESLTAIIWNNTTPLPNSDLQGLNNPNMLIYVADASLAPANRDNVIVGNDSTGYTAKNIVLTDVEGGNGNFYCPREFKAEMISYTHEYRQTTETGVARGWETIALPFTVQTIMHEKNGLIAPFGNDASEKHFWLRQFSERGLARATVIEANMPYLISMPNSDEYSAEYNQAGLVSFSAQDAIVPQTEINVMEAHGINDNMVMFVPCFQLQSAEEQVYALNVGEQREGYPEGSVFVANYRNIRPFEAFTVHHGNGPAPQYIPIFDMNGGTTDIENVRNKMEDGRGSIWYDLHGRKLQQKPSQKGVYILNGKKIIQ